MQNFLTGKCLTILTNPKNSRPAKNYSGYRFGLFTFSFHLYLFSLLSLFISISASSPLYLFLCFSLFLSLFSFTTHCFFSFSSSLLSLSSQLSFLNSLTLFTRSVGSLALSLSVRNSQTYPESETARALAHTLNGELLASRRKNL